MMTAAHLWNVAAAVFVVLCLLCALGFLAWCAWSLFWRLYDEAMQNRLRIKNSDIDEAYVSGQFYVPHAMRDFK